jgi:ribokinase
VPVVKLGARGCRVMGRRVPAPAVAVVDGTGAGDAFAAAFCLAYLDGAPPLDAAGRAVLVGSRACTHPGARPVSAL